MDVYRYLLVRPEGFEPSTVGLKGHCSTTELRARMVGIMSEIIVFASMWYTKCNLYSFIFNFSMLFKKVGKSRTSLYLAAGIAVVALAGVLFVNQQSYADSRYTFVVKGDVMRLDTANKNLYVYLRQVNSAAEHDEGQTLEINTRSAKFYKYDGKQKKVRASLGSISVGDEVVVRGTGGSGTYDAMTVTKNDNLVKIRGTVDGQSITDNYLSVELDSVVYESTGKPYKPNSFTKSNIVRVYYDDDSIKFTSRDGNAMNEDEISNDNEKVTLRNIKVRYGSRFEADASQPVSQIIDGKHL